MNRVYKADIHLVHSSIKFSYLGYHFLSIILRTCKQFEVTLKRYGNLKQLADELAHTTLTMGKNEFVAGAPLNVTLNCGFKGKVTALTKTVMLIIPQVWLALKVDSWMNLHQ